MSEAKRKARTRSMVLDAEPRCIYCAGEPETLEHMPPRAIFQDRLRPSGMEFGVCKSCNEGTRASDAVAALFAMLHPDYGNMTWQGQKIRDLVSTIRARAPEVLNELAGSGDFQRILFRNPKTGILRYAIQANADGPHVAAHLNAFGAKLGMALYREHVGTALPLDGVVWCQFSSHAGMTRETLEDRLHILPLWETLRQGRKNVGDQFAYRYNCDGKTIIAAVVQIHKGLFYTLFASAKKEYVDLFTRSPVIPKSILVKSGGVLDLLNVKFPERSN